MKLLTEYYVPAVRHSDLVAVRAVPLSVFRSRVRSRSILFSLLPSVLVSLSSGACRNAKGLC